MPSRRCSQSWHRSGSCVHALLHALESLGTDLDGLRRQSSIDLLEHLRRPLLSFQTERSYSPDLRRKFSGAREAPVFRLRVLLGRVTRIVLHSIRMLSERTRWSFFRATALVRRHFLSIRTCAFIHALHFHLTHCAACKRRRNTLPVPSFASENSRAMARANASRASFSDSPVSSTHFTIRNGSVPPG